MHRKELIQFSLLFIISLFPFEFLSSQKILDHEIFLERIKNSSDNIYAECIKEYNSYLKNAPDDVPVLIEKCKFIQFAQYDEEEEYNPNQDEFDSCSADLIKRFPTHPEVLSFQTTYLWGDELKKVFEQAEKSIEDNPEKWTRSNLALLYKSESDYYYYDSDYRTAYKYIIKAIFNDEQYKSSLEYARILIEQDNKEAAVNALISSDDDKEELWLISEKADLLLKLKEYTKALDFYNKIRKRDSTYINNAELASTFEGIERYDLARDCLIADTAKNWDKEGAIRSLLKHDLRYQDGATCIATYNNFRDFGFKCDPIGFYRLKLFFAHPIQPWKLRDLLGIFTLIITMALLVSLPYIWILPVYFVGQRWKFISNKKPFDSPWRLDHFWFVSAGYLIASLFACMADPEILYRIFNSSYYTVETTQEQRGFELLIFMIIMAILGVVVLFKAKLKILLSNTWSIGKSILMGVAVLIAFRIIIGLYVQLGVRKLGISIDDLVNFQNILYASRQDIEALITTFGKGSGILLIGLIAPFYEEVLFRGVILDSCQRHLNFNVANVFQAALFSAIHLSLFQFPVFFLFGLFAGIMRKKSGGLLPGLVLHIVNNTLVMLFLIFR